MDDWQVVKKKPKKPKSNTVLKEEPIQTQVKSRSTTHIQPQRKRDYGAVSQYNKLDESNESGKIKTTGIEMGKRISQARMAKNIKQKDLANLVNIQPTLLNQIERGTAKYDANIINRIQKVLGVRVRN